MSYLSISREDIEDADRLFQEILDLRSMSPEFDVEQNTETYNAHVNLIFEKFCNRAATFSDVDMRRNDFIMAKQGIFDAVLQHVVAEAEDQIPDLAALLQSLRSSYLRFFAELQETSLSLGTRLIEATEDIADLEEANEELSHDLSKRDEQVDDCLQELKEKDEIIAELRALLGRRHDSGESPSGPSSTTEGRDDGNTPFLKVSDFERQPETGSFSLSQMNTPAGSNRAQPALTSSLKGKDVTKKNGQSHEELRTRLKKEVKAAKMRKKLLESPNRSMPWDSGYKTATPTSPKPVQSPSVALKTHMSPTAAKYQASTTYGGTYGSMTRSAFQTAGPGSTSGGTYASSAKWSVNQVVTDQLTKANSSAMIEWLNSFRAQLKDFLNEQELLEPYNLELVSSPTPRFPATSDSVVGGNGQRLRPLSLHECTDLIGRIYESKFSINQKVGVGLTSNPGETMEHHVYNFLEKKYGVRSLAIPRAAMLVNAMERYAEESNVVAVFQKIFCNEVQEGFKQISDTLESTIYNLLVHQVEDEHKPKRSQHNFQARAELERERKIALENKLVNGIEEHDWVEITRSIYQGADAKALCVLLKRLAVEETERNPKLDANTNVLMAAESRGYRSKSYDYLRSTVPKKPTPKLQYKTMVKCILDFHLTVQEDYLKSFKGAFMKVDSDNDGILTPLEFRDLFDDIRNPTLRSANAIKQQRTMDKLDTKKEDELFFSCLEVADRQNTDRITFSEATKTYDIMRGTAIA